MDELKTILLKHRDKYPLMTFIDYLKIIYQNTFGPGHFGSGPSLQMLIDAIKSEAMVATSNTGALLVDIGFDYVRVDLQVIRQNLMTAETLGKIFHESMKKLPGKDDIHAFRERVDMLVDMIDQGLITLSQVEQRAVLAKIDFDHPAPLTHSNQYREAYQPHYRVVSKTILRENLKLSDELSI